MKLHAYIEKTLQEAFAPVYISVKNESHRHNVPSDAETHFNVVIVSECFSGLPQIKRQKQVYQALSFALQNGVHALSMVTSTPEEWDGVVQESPPCLGGG